MLWLFFLRSTCLGGKASPYNGCSEVPVRSRICIPIIFLFICTLAVTRAVAQQTMPRPTQPPPEITGAPADGDEARERLAHDMEKKAAKERAAAIKSDTDKLLKLSVELKSYVDKSDENILSLEVIKKAEEIEKLAKSVKDKMKGPN
jgi:hypothetical protein